MKKVTIFFAVLFVAAGITKAQSNKEEVDFMQAAIGMEKKAMVADLVNVDPAQNDAFWKLYDEYETSRKDLGKKRIDLFIEYNDNFEKWTNEQADAWMKSALDLSSKTDALLLSYYKKIKKATNPVTAMEFYQVEMYILTSVRNKILGELPMKDKK
jgi:hypothetical protein